MYILFAVRFVDISLVPIIIVSKSIIVSNEYEMYTQQRMYYAWTYFFLGIRSYYYDLFYQISLLQKVDWNGKILTILGCFH